MHLSPGAEKSRTPQRDSQPPPPLEPSLPWPSSWKGGLAQELAATRELKWPVRPGWFRNFKMRSPISPVGITVTKIKCQHNIPEQVPARVGATGWAVPTGAMRLTPLPESHFLSFLPSFFLSLLCFCPVPSHPFLPTSLFLLHTPKLKKKKKEGVLLTTLWHLQIWELM